MAGGVVYGNATQMEIVMGQQKQPEPQKNPPDPHPRDRRADFARQEKAERAKDHSNAGQSGNINQNTHNQGYQQDR